jgi:phosphoribosylanthranilate isomerase
MINRWNQTEGVGTRVKICGITSIELAHIAVDAGADAIGLVMVSSSPRGLSWQEAEAIRATLPPHVEAIGLVQDEPDLESLARVYHGSWLQFHGQETPETVGSWKGPTIRGIEFSPSAVAMWDQLKEIDLLLVDGSSGGQGVAIDLPAVASATSDLHHPLVLAGGLTPESVHDAICTVQPWAVDVSSGVESTRGIKDPGLIRAFCQAAQAT